MNSLILISPSKTWGFQPIVSGKKRSDTRLAKHLHSLRPGYARLGLGIDKADSDARTRIDEIKAKLTGGNS